MINNSSVKCSHANMPQRNKHNITNIQNLCKHSFYDIVFLIEDDLFIKQIKIIFTSNTPEILELIVKIQFVIQFLKYKQISRLKFKKKKK